MCCMPCAWGHLVQTLSDYFDHLFKFRICHGSHLWVSILQSKDAVPILCHLCSAMSLLTSARFLKATDDSLSVHSCIFQNICAMLITDWMCWCCQGVKAGSRQKAFVDTLLDMACFADCTQLTCVLLLLLS